MFTRNFTIIFSSYVFSRLALSLILGVPYIYWHIFFDIFGIAVCACVAYLFSNKNKEK